MLHLFWGHENHPLLSFQKFDVSPIFDPQVNKEKKEKDDRNDQKSRDQDEVNLGDPFQVSLRLGVLWYTNLFKENPMRFI